MAGITLHNSDDIGSGTRIDIETNEDHVIAEGVTIASTSPSGVAVSSRGTTGTDLFVYGTVIGGNVGLRYSAFREASSSSHEITIGQTGRVIAGNSTAISVFSDNSRISNAGEVSISRGTGVSLSGEDISLFNSGTITSTGATITASAVRMTGDNAFLSNSGVLQNSNERVGTVVAVGSASDSFKLVNTGEILSAGLAFRAISGTAVTVENAGLIVGDVKLGSGNDTFDGRDGTLRDGQVIGGTGNDTYFIDDGTIAIVEEDGGGFDRIKSTVNFTLVRFVESLELIGSDDINGFGNSANNSIVGNSGQNRLLGDAGNDALIGRGGADKMNGGLGDDGVSGGTGNDVLRGGGGADQIFGGNGDDILLGGLGQDNLAGNDGRDAFKFSRPKDSLKGNQADRILDFEKGADVIDFSGLPGGKYSLNINAGFSSNGASIRTVRSGDNTSVLVDTNGDRQADMKILVEGVLGLTESDFLL